MSFAAIDWSCPCRLTGHPPFLRLPVCAGQLISSDVAHDRCRRVAGAHRAFRQRSAEGICNRLGKILLAFVMLWAYFDFSRSDHLVGDQPKKSALSYAAVRRLGRRRGIVLVFHFFVLFFLLLSKDVKRNSKVLRRSMCSSSLRLVDLYWMTRRNLLLGPANLVGHCFAPAHRGLCSAFSLSI